MTINKVLIEGYIGSEPQTRIFESGQITNLSVATSETWKDQDSGEWKESTDWHKVVVKNGTSKYVNDNFKKGDKIFVLGKLQTRSFINSEGNKIFITEIIGKEVKKMSKTESNEN